MQPATLAFPQPATAETPNQDIRDRIKSYQDQIGQYEAQIADLQTRIRDLNSELDCKIPIGRLHPEILAEIFSLLVSEWIYLQVNKNKPGFRRVPYFHWCTILHVCRAWRDIALQTPYLWTTFGPKLPTFVATAIKNSGCLPLNILDAPFNRPSFEQILEHMTRIRTFRATGSTSLYDLINEPGWATLYAPQLCTLHLTADIDDEDPFRAFQAMAAPNLTSLTIIKCSVDTATRFCRATVTHLDLTDIQGFALLPLLIMIGQLPSLVRLAMTHVCEDANLNIGDDYFGTKTSPISLDGLQHLKSLSIRSQMPASTYVMLCHLPISDHTNVQLHSQGEVWTPEATNMACEIRKRVLGSLTTAARDPSRADSRIKSLHLRAVQFHCGPRFVATDKIRFGLTIWTKEVPEDRLYLQDFPVDSCEDAKLDFETCITPPVVDVFVTQLLVHSHLGDATSMALECNKSLVQPNVWHALFAAIPKLRFLDLHDCAARAFVRYHNSRTQMDGATGDGSPSPLIYPSLKHLKLTGAVLATSCHNAHAEDLFPRLITTLTTLKDQGLRLEKLQLDYPINLGDDEKLKALRAVGCAAVVEVSGEEDDRGTERNGGLMQSDDDDGDELEFADDTAW